MSKYMIVLGLRTVANTTSLHPCYRTGASWSYLLRRAQVQASRIYFSEYNNIMKMMMVPSWMMLLTTAIMSNMNDNK